mmetsp:Transcript_8612/g.28728  ORF Transcript_8612/g.28728 Transcript_8612/m.28728 type:complete len:97 (+) Transcript_8612:1524-1814(+)
MLQHVRKHLAWEYLLYALFVSVRSEGDEILKFHLKQVIVRSILTHLVVTTLNIQARRSVIDIVYYLHFPPERDGLTLLTRIVAVFLLCNTSAPICC